MPQHIKTINTPHITLGLSLADGLSVLKSIGTVNEEKDPEHHYRVETPDFKAAIYEKEGVISSVWYDDPIGRGSDAEKEQKVKLYLKRYGSLPNWELRMNNGWMIYWFNPRDKAAMVYDIHKDVIRFNQYNEPSA